MKIWNILLLALCISTNLVSASSIMQRAERFLQTGFGTYVPQRDPSVKQNCDDRGAKSSELTLSEKDFKSTMESATSKYAGPRAEIEATLLSAGSASVDVGAVINKLVRLIIVPAAFFVLSFLSMFFLFLWCIFSCCCKKTCCLKEKKAGEPLGFCQKCIFVTAFVIGTALVICSIVWAARMGSTIRQIKYIPCSVAILYSDVLQGTEKGTDASAIDFLGVKGFSSMIASIISSINDFSTFGDADTILSYNLPTTGSNLVTQAGTFVSTESAATSYRMGATDDTKPDSVKTVSATIGTVLKGELDVLSTFGKNMHDAAQVMKNLGNGQQAGMTKSFTDVKTQIDSMGDQIKNLFDLFNSGSTVKSIESGMNAVLIVSIILVTVLTVFFLFVMFMNLVKNKLHCLKCLNKLFMLLKILMSTLLNIAGLALVILCFIMSNMCYFFFQASTNSAYSDKITQVTVRDIFKNCIMSGGTGDLSKLVGDTTSITKQLDDFQKTMTAFTDMDKYALNFTGTVSPTVGTNILNDYNDRKNIKIDDLKTSPAYSFEEAVNFMNTRLTGTNNVAALNGNCPGGVTSSASGDGAGVNSMTAYCIQFGSSTFPTVNPWKPQLRWTVASGTSTTDRQAVEDKKDSFVTIQSDYISRMTTFANKYNTDLYTPEKNYMTSLKSAYDSLQSVKTKSASTVAFLTKFSNDLFKALNCQILGRHIRTFEVALCAKFTYKLMFQTDALIALGLILFFHSWCVCCGIRCAPKRDENNHAKPNQVHPDVQSGQEGQLNPEQAPGQPQFQNAGQKYV